MKPLGAALALAAVLAAGFAPPARALEGAYESVTTRIPVKLTVRLSSQDAVAGQPFFFDTTSSVQLEGQFLPAGSHGRGVVISSRAARGPHPGALVVEARSLDLPDGRSAAVGLAPGALAVVLSGDRRSFPVPAVGAAPIVLGGSRVTNVVYEKGTPFAVIAPPPETPAPADSSAP